MLQSFLRRPLAVFVVLGIFDRFIPQHDQGEVVGLKAHLLTDPRRCATTLHIDPKIGDTRVQLDEGSHVEALVPIYGGKNIISVNDAAELKRLIVRARGTNGSGIEYVTGVARELATAGVVDPVVTNLMRDISS